PREVHRDLRFFSGRRLRPVCLASYCSLAPAVPHLFGFRTHFTVRSTQFTRFPGSKRRLWKFVPILRNFFIGRAFVGFEGQSPLRIHVIEGDATHEFVYADCAAPAISEALLTRRHRV